MNSRPLLITSNGFGMGHLVRQLTLAEHFPEAMILTLSGAAPIALRNGARLEYCPSYSMPWLSKRAWHRGYLKARIVALAEEMNADVLVFDGVVPYVGLVNAVRELGIPAVWMRRGVWRDSAMTWPLKYSKVFDLIIEPGDLGSTHDHGVTSGRTDATKVGVITAAGQMKDRQEAGRALGIDPTRPTVLFNIGSNRNLDLSQLNFDEFSEWNVIATSDALGRHRSQHSIHQVSGIFPLHPYLSAVDLAVTSVGYNAAHEFVACGVPTIVVPADNATDDQYARADAMVAQGCAVRADSGPELAAQLATLMKSQELRESMSLAARRTAEQWSDGAAKSAALISSVTAGRHPAPMRLHVRNVIERVLAIADRKRDQRQPVFTEELTEAMLSAPVEHLAIASERYRTRRAHIAARW